MSNTVYKLFSSPAIRKLLPEQTITEMALKVVDDEATANNEICERRFRCLVMPEGTPTEIAVLVFRDRQEAMIGIGSEVPTLRGLKGTKTEKEWGITDKQWKEVCE